MKIVKAVVVLLCILNTAHATEPTRSELMYEGGEFGPTTIREIFDRADDCWKFTFVPTTTFVNSTNVGGTVRTFERGQEYYGIPYTLLWTGQDPKSFSRSLESVNSNLYGAQAIGSDCSTFVSYCWQTGGRNTTAAFINDTDEWTTVVTNANLVTNVSDINPGDALVYRHLINGEVWGHMRLVENVDDDTVYFYEQVHYQGDNHVGGKTWYGVVKENEEVEELQLDGYKVIRRTQIIDEPSSITNDNEVPCITLVQVHGSNVLMDGERFVTTVEAEDRGGAGLDRIEVWMRQLGSTDGVYSNTWREIRHKRINATGNHHLGVFQYIFPEPGYYQIGFHAVDRKYNWNDESNSQGSTHVDVIFPVLTVVVRDPVLPILSEEPTASSDGLAMSATTEELVAELTAIEPVFTLVQEPNLEIETIDILESQPDDTNTDHGVGGDFPTTDHLTLTTSFEGTEIETDAVTFSFAYSNQLTGEVQLKIRTTAGNRSMTCTRRVTRGEYHVTVTGLKPEDEGLEVDHYYRDSTTDNWAYIASYQYAFANSLDSVNVVTNNEGFNVIVDDVIKDPVQNEILDGTTHIFRVEDVTIDHYLNLMVTDENGNYVTQEGIRAQSTTEELEVTGLPNDGRRLHCLLTTRGTQVSGTKVMLDEVWVYAATLSPTVPPTGYQSLWTSETDFIDNELLRVWVNSQSYNGAYLRHHVWEVADDLNDSPDETSWRTVATKSPTYHNKTRKGFGVDLTRSQLTDVPYDTVVFWIRVKIHDDSGNVGYTETMRLTHTVTLPPNEEPPEPEEEPQTLFTLRPGPEEGHDVWTTNVYSYDGVSTYPGGGQDTDHLVIGGWGDSYYSLIQFDLSTLPEQATSAHIALYGEQYGNKTPCSLYLDTVSESWNFKEEGTGRDRNRLWWADKPSTTYTGTIIDAPTPGEWTIIDITHIYNQWKRGELDNHGICLRPTSVGNRFSRFASSQCTIEAHRPMLVIHRVVPEETPYEGVSLDPLTTTFDVTTLSIPGVPPHGVATAVSENGHIAGMLGGHGFVYHPDAGYTEIHGVTNVWRVNDNGVVLCNVGEQTHLFQDGILQSIGSMPGATKMIGRGLNNAGVVVGEVWGVNSGYYSGFTCSSTGACELISEYRAHTTAASALNNQGDCVGWSNDHHRRYVTRWTNGVIRHFNHEGEGYGINENGDIAGYTTTGGNRGLVVIDDVPIPVDNLPGSSITVFRDLTDSHVAVGGAYPQSGTLKRGVLFFDGNGNHVFDPGELIDLNDRIDTSLGTILQVWSVSERLTLAASLKRPDGVVVPVVLTPQE